MKKTALIIISLLLILTMTGCKKGQKALKTLECEYDLNSGVNTSTTSTLKITFHQDRKSNELVKGTVVFNTSFSYGLSSSEMDEIKSSLNTQFCEEGFFGEGTNKSCKISTETKSATVTVEIDTEKMLANDPDIEIDESTLEDLKLTLEENFGKEVKCTIK